MGNTNSSITEKKHNNNLLTTYIKKLILLEGQLNLAIKNKKNIETIKQEFKQTKINFLDDVLKLANQKLSSKNSQKTIEILSSYGNKFIKKNGNITTLKDAKNIVNNVRMRNIYELELRLSELESLNKIENSEAEVNKKLQNIISKELSSAMAVQTIVSTTPTSVSTSTEQGVQTNIERTVSPSNVQLEIPSSISKSNKNKLKTRTAKFVGKSIEGLSNRRRLLNDPIQSNAIYPSLLKEVEELELKDLLKNLGMNSANYKKLKLKNMNFDKAKQKINLINLLRYRGYNNTVYERYKNMNFNKAKARILALNPPTNNNSKQQPTK